MEGVLGRTLDQPADHQAAALAMMWNTNPSTVIPTATAAMGSRTSAVACVPLTGRSRFRIRPRPNREN